MGLWKTVCACVGCAVGAGICIASAGMATPFVAASAAPWLIGGGTAAGFLIGDKADKEKIEREKRLEENQRYRDARKEVEDQTRNNKQTQDAINTTIGKINGTIPRQPNETDEYLKNQLIVLNSQLDTGKARVSSLKSELDKIRKNLGGGGSLMNLLGLDKLSFTDKAMIIAGIILVIWLLKG